MQGGILPFKKRSYQLLIAVRLFCLVVMAAFVSSFVFQ